MKIRTGFVANSSSSSFCLLGTIISEKQIREELRQHWKETPETVLRVLIKTTNPEGKDFWWHFVPEDSEDYQKKEKPAFYVGKRVRKLDPHKTIIENANEIRRQLAELFLIPEKEINIDWYEGIN
jgi:hypothetical protein